MQEQIVPFDLMRMLFGDAPPLFLLEIAFRTSVIYFYTLFLLRLIGGRSVSQLSLIEFLLVIALGSAVGDVLFYPDVPLLHAMLVITLVVGADKLLDMLTIRYKTAKRLADGEPTAVVRHGVIDPAGMKKVNIGAAELMSRLRLKGIENLGKIDFAFLEPGGQISVFEADEPRPGLRIAPPEEVVPYPAPMADQAACCSHCGYIQRGDVSADPDTRRGRQCTNCDRHLWTLPLVPDAPDAVAR